jgi:hypothetical protein
MAEAVEAAATEAPVEADVAAPEANAEETVAEPTV